MTGPWTLADLLSTAYEWGMLTAFRPGLASENVFSANRLIRAELVGKKFRVLFVTGYLEPQRKEGGEIAVLVLDGDGRMRRALQAVAIEHGIQSFVWQPPKKGAVLSVVCDEIARPLPQLPTATTTADLMSVLAEADGTYSALRARGLRWGKTFFSRQPEEWAA